MAIAISITKPIITAGILGRTALGYFVLYFNNQLHIIEFTSNPIIHLILAAIFAIFVNILVPDTDNTNIITPKPISAKSIVISSNIDHDCDEIIISNRGIIGLKCEE